MVASIQFENLVPIEAADLTLKGEIPSSVHTVVDEHVNVGLLDVALAANQGLGSGEALQALINAKRKLAGSLIGWAAETALQGPGQKEAMDTLVNSGIFTPAEIESLVKAVAGHVEARVNLLERRQRA